MLTARKKPTLESLPGLQLFRFGLFLMFLGVGWFILSCVTLILLHIVANVTGSFPRLPSAGGIDWAAGLLFLGIYFGSWLLFASGMVLAFLGMPLASVCQRRSLSTIRLSQIRQRFLGKVSHSRPGQAE